MSESEKTLEMALYELNIIIEKMDKSEIPLDESFALYQEGIKLVKYCSKKIDKVEKDIIVLNEESECDEI